MIFFPTIDVQVTWFVQQTLNDIIKIMFLYLVPVRTSSHELSDGHAACAFPLVGGWRRGGRSLRCSGGVSLRARGCLGFLPRLLSGSGCEVSPLAGHRKSLLAKTGQNLCVHVPAAASVGGALFIDSVVLHEALHLYSNHTGRKIISTALKQKVIVWEDGEQFISS